jgi:MFS family permease
MPLFTSEARPLLPVVVALGVTQIIGYGSLYYAFAILVPSIATEFGTSQATLYAIFSAGLLVGGLIAPRVGILMDLHGGPRVMAVGSLLAGLLLAATAFAPSLWAYAGLVILTEIVSVAVLYDAAFATLATLGKARARRAITHLTLIAGFASTLFWPLTGWLVEAIGWRQSYGVFAVLHLAVALPLHLWIARQPAIANEGAAASATVQFFGPALTGREAQLAYAAIAISFAMSGMAISAISVQLVPVLQGLDLGAASYAIAMLMGPGQVMIRLTDALFWRDLHPLTVATISALALALSIVALLIPSNALALGAVFALLFGVGQGLASIVRGTVPLVLFGSTGFGARLGRLTAVRTVLGAGAPFLFASCVEMVGMRAALYAVLLIGVMAAAPLIALRLWLRATQPASTT